MARRKAKEAEATPPAAAAAAPEEVKSPEGDDSPEVVEYSEPVDVEELPTAETFDADDEPGDEDDAPELGDEVPAEEYETEGDDEPHGEEE